MNRDDFNKRYNAYLELREAMPDIMMRAIDSIASLYKAVDEHRENDCALLGIIDTMMGHVETCKKYSESVFMLRKNLKEIK